LIRNIFSSKIQRIWKVIRGANEKKIRGYSDH
jgi:hypothetical protein